MQIIWLVFYLNDKKLTNKTMLFTFHCRVVGAFNKEYYN